MARRGRGYSKRKAPKKSVKPARSTSAGRKQAKQASTPKYAGQRKTATIQAPVQQTPAGKDSVKVRTSSPPATTAPPSRGRRSMGDSAPTPQPENPSISLEEGGDTKPYSPPKPPTVSRGQNVRTFDSDAVSDVPTQKEEYELEQKRLERTSEESSTKQFDPLERKEKTGEKEIRDPVPVDEAEYITNEIKTYEPVYRDFTTTITDVLGRNKIVVEDDFETEGKESKVVDGDYKGNDPRKRLFFEVVYKGIKLKELKTFLNFENNRLAVPVNVTLDNRSVRKPPHSWIFKLYNTVPEDVEEKDKVTIVEEILPSITEDVYLIPSDEENEDVLFLRSPDFDGKKSYGFNLGRRETQYETREDLLTSDSEVAKELADRIISQSIDSSELNVDYSFYDEFVNFSSVERRLKNFKYKLGLLQTYTAESSSLVSISGSSRDRDKWDYKIKDLKNNFTGYEKYLYTNFTSYTSGSETLRTVKNNSAWPKTGGSGTIRNPYVNYHTTSSQGSGWYNANNKSASNYDRENRNRLVNLLPEHIKEDANNDYFLTFMDMIGEHFDTLWAYTKHLSKHHSREEGLKKGFSNDLIFDIGKSLGLDLKDGRDLMNLPKYTLGLENTGSAYTERSVTPEKQIAQEIQKRIINNLPFFLKTKGTVRSLKGIINCYGIPSTILRVREYGGPDLPDSNRTSYLIKKKFTKAIDFDKAQHVLTTWVNDSNSSRKPDTIEFRFKSITSSDATIVESKNSAGTSLWAIRLADNNAPDNKGYVEFKLSGSAGYKSVSSSLLPVYDNEFMSVMLTRTSASGHGVQLTSDDINQNIRYDLAVKKYDSSRSKIYLASTSSLSINGSHPSGSNVSKSYHAAMTQSSTVYIGGAPSTIHGIQFSGSLMEFRYWNTALSMSNFDNHVASPKSYDGNHVSASWTDLVLRYSFDDNKNHNSDGDVRDTSADQSYIQTGSAQGFADETNYSSIVDEEKMFVPNVGPNRVLSNKIRIEDSEVPYVSGSDVRMLLKDESKEKSSQDYAPIDSNKLGIYFAPTDVINEDIMRSVANLDFNQYLGDPRDQFKEHYRGLRDVRNQYWQKYKSPNNFFAYLRLIKYYDQSIFDQFERLTPARANKHFGVVVEPNIFERSKNILYLSQSFEDLSFRTTIDLTQYAKENILALTGSVSDLEGTISGSVDIFSKPSLVRLNSTASNADWGNTYITASVTKGGPEYVFEEVLQPQITGSRVSAHNKQLVKWYSSSLSQSKDLYYSSSYARSTHDTRYEEFSSLANLFFEGCKNTRNTTIDGADPVETTDTKPTRLVVQEPGVSRLRTP